MNFSNFFDLTMELTLPDLLPEGSLFNETFLPENPSTIITHPEIVALNSRIDQFFLESNTQSLRIELEKHKRQKLRTTIKQVKQNMIIPSPDIASLRYDAEKSGCYQLPVGRGNYHYENDDI